jgi:dTDP-4-amino-4,6-dideoxygalactose transaminase
MSEFQAAMGLANLPFIKKENEKRKKIYEYYKKNIKKAEFQLLSASRYNYSYMPVLFDSMKVRNMIFDRLLKAGIKGRKYFYPLVSDYPFLNKRESLPNSKNISRRVLCLPIYADLKQKSVDKIVKIINIK